MRRRSRSYERWNLIYEYNDLWHSSLTRRNLHANHIWRSFTLLLDTNDFRVIISRNMVNRSVNCVICIYDNPVQEWLTVPYQTSNENKVSSNKKFFRLVYISYIFQLNYLLRIWLEILLMSVCEKRKIKNMIQKTVFFTIWMDFGVNHLSFVGYASHHAFQEIILNLWNMFTPWKIFRYKPSVLGACIWCVMYFMV